MSRSRVGAGLRLRNSAWIARHAPREGSLPYDERRIQASSQRWLRSAVAHAYHHVPHYREAFVKRGLRPEDIREPADLAELPLIDRDDLQLRGERLISDALPRETLVPISTGGTSGRPARVLHDPFAMIAGAAHRERSRRVQLRAAGRRVRLRQIIFQSRRSTSATTARAFSRNSLLPRSLRLEERVVPMFAPPEEQIRAIEEFRPDAIWGYGSLLEALFAAIEDRGGAKHLPAIAVYAGDGMSARGRRLLPERFGVAVQSLYGTVEAFHLGFECEAGLGMHMNVDLHPIRILGPDGAELGPGESGEVVLSNLVHRGTVLLNYRLGDIAAWVGEPCPCGRRLPLLSFIEGRRDEWLRGPAGERIHPQTVRILFTPEADQVRAFQVRQLAPLRFAAQVVLAGPEGHDALIGRLRDRFRESFGPEVEVSFEFVERLERTADGKQRAVFAAPAGRPR